MKNPGREFMNQRIHEPPPPVRAFILVLFFILIAGCQSQLQVPKGAQTQLDVGSLESNPQPKNKNVTAGDVAAAGIKFPAPFNDVFEREKRKPLQAKTLQSVSAKNSGEETQRSQKEGTVVRLGVNVYQYAFEPNWIVLPYGRNITLTFQSMDVRHGIAIPDFGINEPIPAEGFVRVNFESKKRGMFPFFSSVYSGPGYKNMTGTIAIN